MPSYSFESLSPADFEDLTRDLLQESLGVRLEAFGPGRDNGIDLRHSSSTEGDLIVQCKHYARSGFAQLLNEIRSSELAKIRKLQPNRYILTTSVDLNPERKGRLVKALFPHCKHL